MPEGPEETAGAATAAGSPKGAGTGDAWAGRSVLALSGGVGGARLLDGLARVLPRGTLTAVVNTGDDFIHWGLAISPDLDTVMYMLSGLSDEARGWGLAGETFAALGAMERLGGASWFQLGDWDLATHLARTEALGRGDTLTEVTDRLCRALGVPARVLPMADVPRRTIIETVSDGALPFQEWFVGRRAAPAVRAVRFEGSREPAPGLIAAIDGADLVIVGPSNPYVSIDPILTLDGVREAIARRPVVALSPIVGGRAVKGPLAGMITQLTGAAASPGAIVRHYDGLLSGILIERGDVLDPDLVHEGLTAWKASTIMHGAEQREEVARAMLTLGETVMAGWGTADRRGRTAGRRA